MDRQQLIRELVEEGYLRTKTVIDAFVEVPREDFVPTEYKKYAYVNEPLPTMSGQTISQPLTIAIMTEVLAAEKGDKVLEVGTGSGYQAALLSKIVGVKGKIITVEIIPELFEFAKENLRKYRNVKVVHADGSGGYAPEAPYDRIIVTADAVDARPLVKQLKDKGKIVIPINSEMFLIEKSGKKKFLGYFAFVPLRGVHGRI